MRLTGSPETVGKGLQKGCRKEGRQEGSDDGTRQGVAGTAGRVKLQAAAAGRMWGPEEAKQGKGKRSKTQSPLR